MKKTHFFVRTLVWVGLLLFVSHREVSSSERYRSDPPIQKKTTQVNLDYPDNAVPDYPALVPLSGYTTEKGKTLAQRYRSQLILVIKKLEEKYSLNQMEIRAVGFLKSPRSGEKDDRYLSVIMEVREEYELDKTSFEKRAETVFDTYVDSVARILLKSEDILEDKDVAGVAICPNWMLKGGKKASPETPMSEGMFICISSKSGKEFSQGKINLDQIASQSKMYARQGDTLFDLTDIRSKKE